MRESTETEKLSAEHWPWEELSDLLACLLRLSPILFELKGGLPLKNNRGVPFSVEEIIAGLRKDSLPRAIVDAGNLILFHQKVHEELDAILGSDRNGRN